MESVTFKSDRYMLTGTLHLPADTPAPMVIGCHGLMADRNSAKQLALAQECRRQGIGYFRFDHRGCGDSQGDFIQVTSLEGRRRDLLDAIDYVRPLKGCNGVIGLFGSSMGGAVCLSVHDIVHAAAMVTFAAPLHSRFPHLAERHVNFSFDIAGDIQGVKNIHVFHGEQDEIVPLEHARILHASAAHPKKLTIQPGGDHRMSNPVLQEEFIRQSTAWFANSFFQR